MHSGRSEIGFGDTNAEFEWWLGMQIRNNGRVRSPTEDVITW
jgi:hypothetical protein